MSEQKHPAGEPGVWKKPNFGLIVALSAVAILLILFAAYFFVRKDSSEVVPKIHQSSLRASPAAPQQPGRHQPFFV